MERNGEKGREMERKGEKWSDLLIISREKDCRDQDERKYRDQIM